VQGIVKDQTGGVMQAVEVRIANLVSGFMRTATTDATGHYVFNNLPPNPSHLTVQAQGFQTLERDVDVRAGAPPTIDLTLALSGAAESVQVATRCG
jgi:Carboxypeptidase regulatory-like domain